MASLNNRAVDIRSGLKVSLVFVLWAAVFVPVYPELWYSWVNNSNNSHGMLVPLIAAFIAWNSRYRVLDAPVESCNWGAVILAASLLLYLAALAGHTAVIARAMIVSSLCGLVLFNFGTRVFKTLAFPLLYLVFMIPVPDSVYGLAAFPLQLFATDVSRAIIQLLGIPVLQEGNMLYFVQTRLEVAEACSGLRSMTAFVMLGVLFAHIMDRPWPRRAALVAAAIPLALFANIVRVTGTGVLAHFYGQKTARGFLHDFSGFAVFVFGLVLLFALYWLLNRTSPGRSDK